jgi:NADP-dependent 3-hydroxy acid dehydrogenase YdfG
MIVITGASDGLGKEVARLYKQQAAFVVNISLEESEYADVNIVADLTKSQDVQTAIARIDGIDQPIQALINCAGVWSDEPLNAFSDLEIDRVFSVNNKGLMLLTSGLIDKIKQDQADIVNVSSIAGTEYGSENGVYSVSKWAVRGFTKHLQQKLSGTGCRVISFCPDGFQSTLMQKVNGKSVSNRSDLMPLDSVALCLKQLIDLPKSIEISEIILKKTGVQSA